MSRPRARAWNSGGEWVGWQDRRLFRCPSRPQHKHKHEIVYESNFPLNGSNMCRPKTRKNKKEINVRHLISACPKNKGQMCGVSFPLPLMFQYETLHWIGKNKFVGIFHRIRYWHSEEPINRAVKWGVLLGPQKVSWKRAWNLSIHHFWNEVYKMKAQDKY